MEDIASNSEEDMNDIVASLISGDYKNTSEDMDIIQVNEIMSKVKEMEKWLNKKYIVE